MSVANRARAEQHATRAAFFIPGFATALWATLVPFAKARTGINDATLGLVLLCLGAGSLLAMPLSGVLAARRVHARWAHRLFDEAHWRLSAPLAATAAQPAASVAVRTTTPRRKR